MPTRLRDTHRRIRTILAMAPAESWDASEAEIVWEALARIVAGRQAVSDVPHPVRLRTFGETSAELRDQFIVG